LADLGRKKTASVGGCGTVNYKRTVEWVIKNLPKQVGKEIY